MKQTKIREIYTNYDTINYANKKPSKNEREQRMLVVK